VFARNVNASSNLAVHTVLSLFIETGINSSSSAALRAVQHGRATIGRQPLAHREAIEERANHSVLVRTRNEVRLRAEEQSGAGFQTADEQSSIRGKLHFRLQKGEPAKERLV
jgi:hypothetical protein